MPLECYVCHEGPLGARTRACLTYQVVKHLEEWKAESKTWSTLEEAKEELKPYQAEASCEGQDGVQSFHPCCVDANRDPQLAYSFRLFYGKVVTVVEEGSIVKVKKWAVKDGPLEATLCADCSLAHHGNASSYDSRMTGKYLCWQIAALHPLKHLHSTAHVLGNS